MSLRPRCARSLAGPGTAPDRGRHTTPVPFEDPTMSASMSRRSFAALTAGFVLGPAAGRTAAADTPKAGPAAAPGGPSEAAFERDYPPPGFKPSWKKPQINRLLVQDFVIYAHSDLAMVTKLLGRE